VDLGEVIRAHRTRLGMSQADLAAAAGVDARQIRRYEAGEQQPLLTAAAAIAAAPGIPLTEFAGLSAPGPVGPGQVRPRPAPSGCAPRSTGTAGPRRKPQVRKTQRISRP
jgi:transcriptional regulator with XRE-family HTH domain